MFDTIDHLSNAQTASDVAQTLVAVGAKFDVAYASHRVRVLLLLPRRNPVWRPW